MSIDIQHDRTNKRFYIEGPERSKGEITYYIDGNIMTIDHTYVDPEYRNHGYAKQLVKAGVEYAKTNQLKIRPTCSYAYNVIDANYPDLIIRS